MKPHLLAAAFAALLYGMSFTLPSASPFKNPASATISGDEAFRGGWKAITSWQPGEFDWWVLVSSWLANPAIWLAIFSVALGRWKWGAIAGGYALALCLTALVRFREMVAATPGYWFWVASAGILFAVSMVALLKVSRRRRF